DALHLIDEDHRAVWNLVVPLLRVERRVSDLQVGDPVREDHPILSGVALHQVHHRGALATAGHAGDEGQHPGSSWAARARARLSSQASPRMLMIRWTSWAPWHTSATFLTASVMIGPVVLMHSSSDMDSPQIGMNRFICT